MRALALLIAVAAIAAGEERLTITGSSTVHPLAAEIAARYERTHPGVRIDVQTGGSTRGIVDARSGRARIGMAPRALKDDERDLTAIAIALSVGQQQRLCLARVLALRPEVVLMDEPCSALDPLAAEVVDDLIAGLRGFYTVVLVTHDLDQARRLADRMAVLWPGEHGGRPAMSGTPAEIAAMAPEQHPRLARYLGADRATPAPVG